MNRTEWRSSDCWAGNPSDLANRVPLEVYLQQKCCQATGVHFPAILNWAQDHNNLVMTMYVEFCAHGDLETLADHYTAQGDTIPEPFLWTLFMRLVESCLVMSKGTIDGPPVDGWRQIVHRDIKSGMSVRHAFLLSD
jgi:hypothetical protein